MSVFDSVRQLMRANSEIRSKKKIIPQVQALAKAQRSGTMVGTYGSEATLAESLAASNEKRDMMGHIRMKPDRKF